MCQDPRGSRRKFSISMTASYCRPLENRRDLHREDPRVGGRRRHRAPAPTTTTRTIAIRGCSCRDAAFMVIVPSFCPDVPALRRTRSFLYTEDSFKKPNPFPARRRAFDRSRSSTRRFDAIDAPWLAVLRVESVALAGYLDQVPSRGRPNDSPNGPASGRSSGTAR